MITWIILFLQLDSFKRLFFESVTLFGSIVRYESYSTRNIYKFWRNNVLDLYILALHHVCLKPHFYVTSNLTIFWQYYNIRHCIGIMVCVRQWPGRPAFNPESSHTKDLKKWYLIPPCLTLSIIRYESRVKSCNPGKGVAPSPTPKCSSYRKGSLRVTVDYGRQFYFFIIYVSYTTRKNCKII